MRGEADALNNRVVVTESRIENFEELAKKDDSLTEEAKEKVWRENLNFFLVWFSLNFRFVVVGCRWDKQNLIRLRRRIK